MRLRISPSGWAVLAGTVVLYGIGMVASWKQPLMVGVAGAVIVAVGIAGVWIPVRVGVDRVVDPDRTVVGDVAAGRVVVVNESGWFSPAMLGHEPVQGREPVEFRVPRLRSGQVRSFSYPLPTDQRGVFELGPIRFVREDALGLFSREVSFGSVQTLFVHPRVHAIRPLVSGWQRDPEGEALEQARGSSVFDALRAYVIGDDLRLVHWKATAHTGELMVRQQVDPVRTELLVVIDDCVQASHDAQELVVEMAASIAACTLAVGQQVVLLSSSGSLGPTGFVGTSRREVLDQLAAVTMGQAADPQAVFETLMNWPTSLPTVVFVSAGQAQAGLGQLTKLARHADKLIAVFVDTARSGQVLQRVDSGVTVLDVSSATEFAITWNHLV